MSDPVVVRDHLERAREAIRVQTVDWGNSAISALADAVEALIPPTPKEDESHEHEWWYFSPDGIVTATCVICGVFRYAGRSVGEAPTPKPEHEENELDLWRCPSCGRAATIAEWCKRPICVHSWDDIAPEVVDGGDIERRSHHEFWGTPGPDTWSWMVRSVGETTPDDDEPVDVSIVVRRRTSAARAAYAVGLKLGELRDTIEALRAERTVFLRRVRGIRFMLPAGSSEIQDALDSLIAKLEGDT